MGGRIWFVIAAAGRSERYGGSTPKPYLRLAGKTLLEHCLRTLTSVKGIAGGVAVLNAGDRRFERLPGLLRSRVVAVAGGPTRAGSVLNGLQALITADEGDWVLVHDAARPCVSRKDVEALISSCRRDQVGGLLALPVADTVKQADDDGRSLRSVPRERLWHAQTPQMFRLGALVRALSQSLAEGFDATDEAAAIEKLGLRPLLVPGNPQNIKVTRPTDLAFAEAAYRAARRRR